MVLLQAISDTTLVATSDQGLTLFGLLSKGGWVMLPLGLLLLITIFLIIERFLGINASGKVEQNFVDNIRDFVQEGNLKSAESLCRNQRNAIGRIFERAISRIGYPIKDIETTIENASQIELQRLEGNLSYLGVIAGIAPMLGFVGTIAGIIRIFYDISLSNDFNISTISGGMYEKMITSGSGLIIGLIAYAGYHMLNMKIDRFALRLQMAASDFLDVLQKPVGK
ncbi:MotA/TolQ/ExbB proton channel family protein [Ravibacter arvi]|uniref:MotA/TolQ/ExbB proton channel family protein n=1 Tax=Ravibacter arvi TaxID=2051041 RepID=A0ABP8M4A0_9BACT